VREEDIAEELVGGFRRRRACHVRLTREMLNAPLVPIAATAAATAATATATAGADESGSEGQRVSDSVTVQQKDAVASAVTAADSADRSLALVSSRDDSVPAGQKPSLTPTAAANTVTDIRVGSVTVGAGASLSMDAEDAVERCESPIVRLHV